MKAGRLVTQPVKIESDGTRFGTRVLVNGEPLEGVSRVEWMVDATTKTIGVARITVVNVELSATVGELVQEELIQDGDMPV